MQGASSNLFMIATLIGLALTACGTRDRADGYFSSITQKPNQPIKVAEPSQQQPDDTSSDVSQETTETYNLPAELPLTGPYTQDQLTDFTPSSQEKDQAVGTPNKGILESPSNLFLRLQSYKEPAPFRILYPSRNNFFGTAELINMVEFLAQCLRSLISDATLLIGDLSSAHGGRLGSHLSHQTGLDADIGYLTSTMLKEPQFASVLSPDAGPKILLKEQLSLFYFAVNLGQVDRIFIHPKIKSALCDQAKKMGAFNPGKENHLAIETFRRLIPESNHDTHFHLRLKCPAGHPRCVPMPEPESKSGC